MRSVIESDLSTVYDKMGVYAPKFWDNPAIKSTNTTYRDIHKGNEIEKVVTTSNTKIIPDEALDDGGNDPHFN